MNPHKLPHHLSYYTFDKSKADAACAKYGGYVDRYTLGVDVDRSHMPYAVFGHNGALLMDWHKMESAR